jgi:hypothetical protein
VARAISGPHRKAFANRISLLKANCQTA